LCYVTVVLNTPLAAAALTGTGYSRSGYPISAPLLPTLAQKSLLIQLSIFNPHRIAILRAFYAPGFRKEQKAYCLLFESVGIFGGIARIKQVPYKKLEQILEKKKW
jgi:hypothetical protein